MIALLNVLIFLTINNKITKSFHKICIHASIHFQRTKINLHSSTLLSSKLTSQRCHETRSNYKMPMEKVEANQITMKNDINSIQENMDRLLEILLSTARRDGNPEITIDARNIVAQIGSSSLNIPGVINLEFRFHPGYVHPKTVVVPPPVAILVVNLGA